MLRHLSSVLGLLAVFFISLLLVDQSAGTSYSNYQLQTLDSASKKEILSHLRMIADIVNYGYNPKGHYSKRNGGTADTLYNLPDLMDLGRRR